MWDTSRVDSVRFINSTDDFAIDGVLEAVGLPVDLMCKKEQKYCRHRSKSNEKAKRKVLYSRGSYYKYPPDYHELHRHLGHSLYFQSYLVKYKSKEKKKIDVRMTPCQK